MTTVCHSWSGRALFPQVGTISSVERLTPAPPSLAPPILAAAEILCLDPEMTIVVGRCSNWAAVLQSERVMGILQWMPTAQPSQSGVQVRSAMR
jgi:hypothetical protein